MIPALRSRIRAQAFRMAVRRVPGVSRRQAAGRSHGSWRRGRPGRHGPDVRESKVLLLSRHHSQFQTVRHDRNSDWRDEPEEFKDLNCASVAQNIGTLLYVIGRLFGSV
jgi:hypothetical protein